MAKKRKKHNTKSKSHRREEEYEEEDVETEEDEDEEEDTDDDDDDDDYDDYEDDDSDEEGDDDEDEDGDDDGDDEGEDDEDDEDGDNDDESEEEDEVEEEEEEKEKPPKKKRGRKKKVKSEDDTPIYTVQKGFSVGDKEYQVDDVIPITCGTCALLNRELLGKVFCEEGEPLDPKEPENKLTRDKFTCERYYICVENADALSTFHDDLQFSVREAIRKLLPSYKKLLEIRTKIMDDAEPGEGIKLFAEAYNWLQSNLLMPIKLPISLPLLGM